MEHSTSPRFTMTELVESTGLTERTIRYYISVGVVSPALGRGRSRYYTPQHLQELVRVTDLREQRLSIEEIRQQLQAKSTTTSAMESASAWRRIILHPALELHVREDSPDGILALVREIEARSEEWFGAGDDDLPTDT